MTRANPTPSQEDAEEWDIPFCENEIGGKVMEYLATSEYETYGLEAATPQAVVAAASSVIDGHCRRASLGVTQYEERIRLNPDRNTVRLTYLPLAAAAPATLPLVSAQGRYCIPRNGEWPFDDIRLDVALTFGLPGVWTAIDVTAIDYFATTGELTLPLNIVGLWFSEVDIVYTAGLAVIPDVVKFATAQIVKNAQATPGLNVKSGWIDKARLYYFADTLLDQTVQQMLAPYVAQKMG